MIEREFILAFKNKEIENCKIYENADNGNYIIAATYNNKSYLRKVSYFQRLVGSKNSKKAHVENDFRVFFKEFTDKTYTNNYFKKMVEGANYKLVRQN